LEPDVSPIQWMSGVGQSRPSVTAIGTAVYLSKADMLRANQDFG